MISDTISMLLGCCRITQFDDFFFLWFLLNMENLIHNLTQEATKFPVKCYKQQRGQNTEQRDKLGTRHKDQSQGAIA